MDYLEDLTGLGFCRQSQRSRRVDVAIPSLFKDVDCSKNRKFFAPVTDGTAYQVI